MEADAGHLHLSKGDKERAIVLALEKFPGKTQAEIAKQVGCCQQYVQRVKSELTTSGKLEAPATTVGKDGKSRPTSYTKRPSAPVAPAAEPEYANPPTDEQDAPEAEETPRVHTYDAALLEAMGKKDACLPFRQWQQRISDDIDLLNTLCTPDLLEAAIWFRSMAMRCEAIHKSRA